MGQQRLPRGSPTADPGVDSEFEPPCPFSQRVLYPRRSHGYSLARCQTGRVVRFAGLSTGSDITVHLGRLIGAGPAITHFISSDAEVCARDRARNSLSSPEGKFS